MYQSVIILTVLASFINAAPIASVTETYSSLPTDSTSLDDTTATATDIETYPTDIAKDAVTATTEYESLITTATDIDSYPTSTDDFDDEDFDDEDFDKRAALFLSLFDKYLIDGMSNNSSQINERQGSLLDVSDLSNIAPSYGLNLNSTELQGLSLMVGDLLDHSHSLENTFLANLLNMDTDLNLFDDNDLYDNSTFGFSNHTGYSNFTANPTDLNVDAVLPANSTGYF